MDLKQKIYLTIIYQDTTNILILVFTECTNWLFHEHSDYLTTSIIDTLYLTCMERFSPDIGQPSHSTDKIETHVYKNFKYVFC